MTEFRCGQCNVVFVMPNGQSYPRKCGSCGTLGKMSALAKTWDCQHCSTPNGLDKTSCQKCRIERHSRVKSAENGKRPKPDDNLHTIARAPLRSRIIKSLVSDGD